MEATYYTDPIRALENIQKSARWNNRICGARLGITRGHYIAIKKRRRKPSFDLMLRIERVFFIDIHSWEGYNAG